MYGHCAVLMENGNIMFMYQKEVWQYNLLTEDFTQMTEMPETMKFSGCTAFKSVKHSNREVIFIGGGDGPKGNKALILDYAMTENWEESKYILQILTNLPLCYILLRRCYFFGLKPG